MGRAKPKLKKRNKALRCRRGKRQCRETEDGWGEERKSSHFGSEKEALDPDLVSKQEEEGGYKIVDFDELEFWEDQREKDSERNSKNNHKEEVVEQILKKQKQIAKSRTKEVHEQRKEKTEREARKKKEKGEKAIVAKGLLCKAGKLTEDEEKEDLVKGRKSVTILAHIRLKRKLGASPAKVKRTRASRRWKAGKAGLTKTIVLTALPVLGSEKMWPVPAPRSALSILAPAGAPLRPAVNKAGKVCTLKSALKQSVERCTRKITFNAVQSNVDGNNKKSQAT